jgi:selenophosphate synthase
MAYTPELTQEHSATLRRIAWAMKMPMTKAIGEVFDYLGTTLDPAKICSACRDKTRCATCSFNRKGAQHAQNSQL